MAQDTDDTRHFEHQPEHQPEDPRHPRHPESAQHTKRPRVDIEVRVRYGETDQMGVVYHPEYLVWCEMGRTEYIRQLGTSYAELEQSGTRLVVAEALLRYHAPARYDEIVRVETTLSAVRSRALTFDYVICQAESGRRLVSARTLLVVLDSQGKTVPLAPDIRRLLERTPASAMQQTT